MHEASITKSVIDAVLNSDSVKNLNGKITKVNLTAGICQGLVPESMQMYFDMEKKGTALEEAELVVEIRRIIAECPECKKENELDIPYMYCPDCGTPMKLLNGDELFVSSIEVTEE